jgi:AbrB family looped-hinge helix DNA binding protein
MSKVTSKYQVSIPKALAERVGIKVGDDLAWEEAGGTLRVRLGRVSTSSFPTSERLRLFDAASVRQKARDSARKLPAGKRRGWTREDLYTQ